MIKVLRPGDDSIGVMKTKNAINKLEKAGVRMHHMITCGVGRYEGIINGRLVILHTGNSPEDVSTMRVRSFSDQDEMQSDYTAGSFWDTIPQVLRALRVN